MIAKIETALADPKANGVVHVPFGADDVGGEMVAIVSEGLYADPRDALREYVQNSVDAGAQKISVILGASDAKVEDDGGGMSLDELLRARQFAKSSKSSLSSVGFRGIGVYAGFPICDRLRIETQRSGEKVRHTLTFDFKWMRERLLAERTARAGTERTSLPRLMTDGTSIAVRRVTSVPRGKTTVYLDSLSDHALAELADFNRLRQYLVNTLPVGYSDFKGRDVVEEFLRENVPDYRTVDVRVKSTVTKADSAVTREYPSDLGWPVFLKSRDVKSKDDVSDFEPQTRAVIWASVLAPKDSKNPAAGLLYKSRGFTIGEQDRTRRLFHTRQTVVNWMVGEIWVVDPSVTPNAARNDFEATQARRRLEDALAPSIVALKDVIVFGWGLSRAEKVFDDIEKELPALEADAAADSYDVFSNARFRYYGLRRSFDTQRFKKKLPDFVEFTAASAKRLSHDFTSMSEILLGRQEAITSRLDAVKDLLETRFRPDSADEGDPAQKPADDTPPDGIGTPTNPDAQKASGSASSKSAEENGVSAGTVSDGADARPSDAVVVDVESGSSAATTPDVGSATNGAALSRNEADVSPTATSEQLTLFGVVDSARLRISKDFRRSLDALSAALEETLDDQQRNLVLADFRRRLGGEGQ